MKTCNNCSFDKLKGEYKFCPNCGVRLIIVPEKHNCVNFSFEVEDYSDELAGFDESDNIFNSNFNCYPDDMSEADLRHVGEIS